MEQNTDIEKFDFSDDDIDLLKFKILPKTRKNVFYACLIFFLLIPIMPFLPARITNRSAIESTNYKTALLIFFILNGLAIFGIYYLGIVLLNRDINQGYKYIHRTKILRKTWKGNKKFEIEITERPKVMSEKIILNKSEFYNWFAKDLLEIEYLPKTGKILRYKKIEL